MHPQPACAWLARHNRGSKPRTSAAKSGQPQLRACGLSFSAARRARDAGWVREYAHRDAQPYARAYLKRTGRMLGRWSSTDARGAATTRQRPQGASATSGMRRCVGCGVANIMATSIPGSRPVRPGCLRGFLPGCQRQIIVRGGCCTLSQAAAYASVPPVMTGDRQRALAHPRPQQCCQGQEGGSVE